MNQTQNLKGLFAASLKLKTLNDNPYIIVSVNRKTMSCVKENINSHFDGWRVLSAHKFSDR